MPSTQPASALAWPRRAATLGVLLALAACSSPPPPPAAARPAAKPGPAPTAAATASAAASAAPPAAETPAQDAVVIHQADLFGSIRARYGTTVSISSRVMTSKEPPAVGMKGVLYRKIPRGDDVEWLTIADVVVKDPLDDRGTMRVTIVDEKKDALLDGRRVYHFDKGVDIRLTWEW